MKTITIGGTRRQESEEIKKLREEKNGTKKQTLASHKTEPK